MVKENRFEKKKITNNKIIKNKQNELTIKLT